MTNKIKILHVISTRPIGGIGTFLKQIALLIDKNKFELSFIFSSDTSTGEFDLFMRTQGFHVYVIPDFKANKYQYLKSVYSFYKLMSNKYDIVHVHSPNTGFLDLLFARFFGLKKLILHSHSTRHSDKKYKSFRNSLLHWLSVKLCNLRLACSYDAGKFLFGKAKFLVINNSIDIPKFRYNSYSRTLIRKSLSVGDADILLGHIGYFEKVKNHSFLIEIMHELVNIRKLHKYKLVLVGDGTLHSEIKKQIDKKQLNSNVFLLGQRNDVIELMSGIDMFLLPSLFEGFPLTIVEAQAASLPCLVSDSISTNVNVYGRVKFMPINLGVNLWCDTIVSNQPIRDANTNVLELMSNYDINKQIHKLENFYLNFKF